MAIPLPELKKVRNSSIQSDNVIFLIFPQVIYFLVIALKTYHTH
jgi:hypothetical protein